MLLRSSSTPILNTWLPPASQERELVPVLQRARSVNHLCPSMSVTASMSSPQFSDDSGCSSSWMHARVPSDADLGDLVLLPPAPAPKKAPFAPIREVLPSISVKEESDQEEEEADEDSDFSPISSSLLFSSWGLDESVAEEAAECPVLGSNVKDLAPVAMSSGDGCGAGGSGGICGGGRGDAGDADGSSGSSDSNHGNSGTDAYYQRMIEADPGNSLLLSNYAKFLKEARGDLARAEEYCARSILANPGDGPTLALYAELIWQMHKDSKRAESYFERATRAEPNDCYIMASYARFLWDVDDEEDEVVEEEVKPKFLTEIAPRFPLTARS